MHKDAQQITFLPMKEKVTTKSHYCPMLFASKKLPPMNLGMMDVPKTTNKLLKEDDIVFGQELTMREEFGNDFEDFPIYDEYLDDDEGFEDVEQVVKESHRGALDSYSKYEIVEDPPILEDLVEPTGVNCFQVLPSPDA